MWINPKIFLNCSHFHLLKKPINKTWVFVHQQMHTATLEKNEWWIAHVSSEAQISNTTENAKVQNISCLFY